MSLYIDNILLNNNTLSINYKIIKYNLTVIILSYNYLKYTLNCINSVIENTYNKNFEILIIDNNSSIDVYNTLNKLVNSSNNIRIICNKMNYGFSKGMNIGIKNSNSIYIALLNNDILVSKDWDKPLINKLETDPYVFIVQPITNNSGNNSRVDLIYDNPTQFFNKLHLIRKKLIPYYEINSISLYTGMFRLKDLIEIGYLDENFSNGWEDDDLYERIIKINKKVIISTQSIVYHFGSITVGKHNYDKNSLNKLYFDKKWNKKWKSHYSKQLKVVEREKKIKLDEYKPNDNIIKYLIVNYNYDTDEWFRNKYNIEIKDLDNNNKIEIDTTIYKYCNKIETSDENEILKHISKVGLLNGSIYHFKQIQNIIDEDLKLYKIKDSFYIKDNNIYYELNIYVENNIYKKEFHAFMSDIRIEKENSRENNILYCCYLGYIDRGKELLDKLIKNKKSKSETIYSFILKSKNENNDLLQLIEDNFSNYIIFISKEYGNDIIPSLQAIYYILNKYDIQYVYKLHTKKNTIYFNKTIDYLLEKSIEELIEQINYNKSNCVGHPELLLSLKKDTLFNMELKNRYKHLLDEAKSFIAMTNFFCEINVIRNILYFIKNNSFRSYFLNNMYDSNIVNLYNSPIHFLDRLFGIIKLKNNIKT